MHFLHTFARSVSNTLTPSSLTLGMYKSPSLLQNGIVHPCAMKKSILESPSVLPAEVGINYNTRGKKMFIKSLINSFRSSQNQDPPTLSPEAQREISSMMKIIAVRCLEATTDIIPGSEHEYKMYLSIDDGCLFLDNNQKKLSACCRYSYVSFGLSDRAYLKACLPYLEQHFNDLIPKYRSDSMSVHCYGFYFNPQWRDWIDEPAYPMIEFNISTRRWY